MENTIKATIQIPQLYPYSDIYGTEPLFGISICQPFASLMLSGKLESRIWDANPRMFGKLILIHASKRSYNENQVRGVCGPRQYERVINDFNVNRFSRFTGCGIAIGRLIGSRRMQKSDEDRAFVEYHSELFVQEYEDIRQIEQLPMTGQLGFYSIKPELIQQIRILTTRTSGVPSPDAKHK